MKYSADFDAYNVLPFPKVRTRDFVNEASWTNMGNSGRVTKSRSRQACKRCHDRRVRCDVTVKGIPCSGCVAGNLDGACRVLESRKVRGEDGRFSARASDPTSQMSPASPAEARSAKLPEVPTRRLASPGQQSPSEEASILADEEDHQPAHRPASDADQWSNIISRNVASVPDGHRMTYVGESWNLSYMIQWNESTKPGIEQPCPSERESDSPRVHIAMPMSQDTPSPRSVEALTKLSGRVPTAIYLSLIDAYFNHNHIHYPVIAEQEFRGSFANKTVPPLLLSAVLYAGSIHAPDSVIYRAGFNSRQECLRTLYVRSKSMFFEEENDTGTSDQLCRVQAAFLLHHMWLSPTCTMDCWTWLSLAIRLAQNMGMHRSTSRSSLREDDRKLWKRIWWSLYVGFLSHLGLPKLRSRMINDQSSLETLTSPAELGSR